MINKVCSKTKEAIKRKSAYSLPDRPSDQGMKPDEIKRAFYQPVVDSNNSVLAEIDRVIDEVNDYIEKTSDTHFADKENPHGVTKEQLGLENVDNTADRDKVVKEAGKAMNDGKGQNIAETYETKTDAISHKTNKSNPHNVTKEQVGLGKVTNHEQVKASEKGAANGVATLDTNRRVSRSQMPNIDYAFLCDNLDTIMPSPLAEAPPNADVVFTLNDIIGQRLHTLLRAYEGLQVAVSKFIPDIDWNGIGLVVQLALKAAGKALGGVKSGGDVTIADGIITVKHAGAADKVNKKLTFGGKSFDGSSDTTITAADLGLSSALRYIGRTTDNVFDESLNPTVVINGQTVTPSIGDVVMRDYKEFVWTGSSWEELGDGASHALKTVKILAGKGLEGGGNLSANRTLSAKAGVGVTVDESGINVKYGSAANTACEGNDSRLSDARTPKAHTHSIANVAGLQDELADITAQIGDINSILDAINGEVV